MTIVCHSPITIHNLSPNSDGFYSMMNPFQYSGLKWHEDMMQLPGNKVFVRVDFPGVNDQTINFTTDKEMKTIFLEGEEPRVWDQDQNLRKYCTFTGLKCNCCRISDIDAKFADGCLRIISTNVKLDNSVQSDKFRPPRPDIAGTEIMDNPIVLTGSRAPYEVRESSEGLYVRVDMPGVAKKDVAVWVRNGELRFSGRAQKFSPYEDEDRCYRGAIVLSSLSSSSKGDYKVGKFKHEMKNGVLRFMVPTSKRG